MASLLLRRSGISVGLVCDAIGWRADTVIQAGVGYNHQEVDVLKAEWPGLRWYGVDPHPAVAEKARHDPLYDGVFECAASDRPGPVTLWVKPRHADGSALSKVADDCRQVEATADTLDRLFLPSKLVDFGRLLLWLDCEGHERQALDGAKCLLRRASVVNVEMTARPPSKEWCRPVEVHTRLLRAGFRREWIHTGRISSGQYDATYVRRELFRPEYCCDPI